MRPSAHNMHNAFKALDTKRRLPSAAVPSMVGRPAVVGDKFVRGRVIDLDANHRLTATRLHPLLGTGVRVREGAYGMTSHMSAGDAGSHALYAQRGHASLRLKCCILGLWSKGRGRGVGGCANLLRSSSPGM